MVGGGRKQDGVAMVEFAGDEMEDTGNGLNGDGFTKSIACWCRRRQDKPLGGDGFRRGCRRWTEKLAEASPQVSRSSRFRNFDFRSSTIGVTARKNGRTFRISELRATPAYI